MPVNFKYFYEEAWVTFQTWCMHFWADVYGALGVEKGCGLQLVEAKQTYPLYSESARIKEGL
jgi:hypothetical protein